MWEWAASEWEAGSERRVLRGGSFLYNVRIARAAYRLRNIPHSRSRNHGVRVAAALFSPTSEPLKH